MVNSRAKGNQAERDVIKIFKKHFGGHWERKPMGIPGPDILAPDNFNYNVEVKNDKSIKLKHLYKPCERLKAYWQQAIDQSTKDKLPLLCIKIEGLWFAWSGFSVAEFPSYWEWQLLDRWCADRPGLI
jgi:Holliday junction resolvase